MCSLAVGKTDSFGSVVDSKRKCVQKTSIVLSHTASGHVECMWGGGCVTEILEGLVWRRRFGWADGRKRVPRNVRRPFIKHFQVSQDEELRCSSCRATLAGSVNSKSVLRGSVPSIPSACHLSVAQKLCTDTACSTCSSVLATRPASLTNPYGTA